MKKIEVAVSLIFVFIIAFFLLVPMYINHAVTKAVLSRCSQCRFKMDDPGLNLFAPWRITIHNLHFTTGDVSTLETDVQFDSLNFGIDVIPALQKNYRVHEARIENLRVKITDGDKDDGKHSDGASPQLPKLLIGQLNIAKGHFEYHRILNGVRASIEVSDIHGPVKNITLADAPTPITAEFECLFQGSGPHQLKLGLRPFARPAIVDVDLHVHHQDMEGLSRFLMPNDGVELHGELVEGRGVTHMVGRHLHSEVWAEYRDLKTKIHKAEDRSQVAAFFTNLGTAVTMKKENLDTLGKNQERGIALDREKDESLVHFLLRGWKEAAMRVASAPKK